MIAVPNDANIHSERPAIAWIGSDLERDAIPFARGIAINEGASVEKLIGPGIVSNYKPVSVRLSKKTNCSVKHSNCLPCD
jgi:hypothetical protein